MGKQWKQCQTSFFWAPKSLQMVTACMLMGESYYALDSSSNGTEEIRGSFIDIGQDLGLILAPFENCQGIFKLHLDGHCV